MHCLPALHNRDIRMGQAIYDRRGLNALEVTDEVLESPASIVFDQAGNRLHMIEALVVATAGDARCGSRPHPDRTRDVPRCGVRSFQAERPGASRGPINTLTR